MRVIDSHTEGEPTRLIVEGGPDARRRPARRAAPAVRRALRRRSRLRAQRTARLRCDGRRAALRAGRSRLRCRAHLLQQCRLSRHVRPRDDRRRGDACAYGPHRSWACIASRRRSESSTVELHEPQRGHHRERAELCSPARRENRRRGSRRRHGDVAWGGNWFFLTDDAPCAIEPANIPRLTEAALAVRAELDRAGHRGRDGGEIDHIEFFTRAADGADSRNFVLCPGGAYDRSPCGTGTSAKLACLAAEGALRPARPGSRRASSAVDSSAAMSPWRAGRSGRASPGAPGSRRRRRSSAILPIPFPTASPALPPQPSGESLLIDAADPPHIADMGCVLGAANSRDIRFPAIALV